MQCVCVSVHERVCVCEKLRGDSSWPRPACILGELRCLSIPLYVQWPLHLVDLLGAIWLIPGSSAGGLGGALLRFPLHLNIRWQRRGLTTSLNCQGIWLECLPTQHAMFFQCPLAVSLSLHSLSLSRSLSPLLALNGSHLISWVGSDTDTPVYYGNHRTKTKAYFLLCFSLPFTWPCLPKITRPSLSPPVCVCVCVRACMQVGHCASGKYIL
jgi:hypothetical protein